MKVVVALAPCCCIKVKAKIWCTHRCGAAQRHINQFFISKLNTIFYRLYRKCRILRLCRDGISSESSSQPILISYHISLLLMSLLLQLNVSWCTRLNSIPSLQCTLMSSVLMVLLMSCQQFLARAYACLGTIFSGMVLSSAAVIS